MARPSVDVPDASSSGEAPAAPVNLVIPSLEYAGDDLGETITCNPGGWTGDPAFAYQWRRDGVPIGGATAATYALAGADNGKVITCRVTATEGELSAGATSGQLGPLAFTPVNTDEGSIVQSGDSIIRTVAATWLYAASVSLQWLRNGSPVSGQTGATYTGSRTHMDGFVLRSRAVNGARTADAFTSEVVYAVAAPANVVPPSLDYTDPDLGSVITCLPGTWSGSPSFAYQWRRGGTDLGGATGSTYTLTADDDQSVIDCMVTASNVGGDDLMDSDDLTVEFVPVNHVAIVIAYDGFTPNTVSIVEGPDWQFATTQSLKWFRNSVLVAGQTDTTYTGTADAGDLIQVQSEATNILKNHYALSNVLAVPSEAIPPPVNTLAPVVSGNGAAGSEHACTGGTWEGATTLTYQWLFNGFEITGATDSTYTPTTGDFGGVLACVVTATNGGGSVDEESSNSITVAFKIPVNTEAPLLSFSGGNYSVTTGEWSGNPQAYEYFWYVNTVLLPGETGSSLDASELLAGDEVYCLVTASNPAGSDQASSNTGSYTPPVNITLYWNDNSDNETGFRLYWGNDGTDFPNVVETGPNQTSMTVSFPVAGTYYAYLKAFNSGGESAATNTLTITAS